uniref:RRM domain-containing protein n=1 Tax=Macrostomum lignano TaxID=282301 RepID=A0A1I8IVY7_9PLAT
DGLTRAIVEFERLEDAALAKPFLNGANMYTNCNAIRCDYARANAFEYFMSRETVLEEYRYDIDADSMTSMSMVGAASGAGAGMNKRARVVPGGGGGGGLLGNPNDEVGLLGTRLQGLVGAGPGHAIGGVVGRPGQLGGAGVGAAGGAANQELLAQSAMSLVSRVAAAAAAANPAAAGGFAAPYGHPQAGQNIIVVRGLSSQMNCDRLFNVLVLYGNVSRVKFLTTKEGFALVEMCDSGSAQQALQHLNGQRVLGSIVRDNVKRNTKDFTLPDGTLAEKSYDSLKFNRFMTPESAAKNQASLGKIGPVLYFWGCPDGSDEETVRDALKEAGAPAPVEVAMQTEKCTTGWITFETPQDATDAICLANHSIVGESARLKLTYAVNKKDGSGSRPSNANATAMTFKAICIEIGKWPAGSAQAALGLNLANHRPAVADKVQRADVLNHELLAQLVIKLLHADAQAERQRLPGEGVKHGHGFGLGLGRAVQHLAEIVRADAKQLLGGVLGGGPLAAGVVSHVHAEYVAPFEARVGRLALAALVQARVRLLHFLVAAGLQAGLEIGANQGSQPHTAAPTLYTQLSRLKQQTVAMQLKPPPPTPERPRPLTMSRRLWRAPPSLLSPALKPPPPMPLPARSSKPKRKPAIRQPTRRNQSHSCSVSGSQAGSTISWLVPVDTFSDRRPAKSETRAERMATTGWVWPPATAGLKLEASAPHRVQRTDQPVPLDGLPGAAAAAASGGGLAARSDRLAVRGLQQHATDVNETGWGLRLGFGDW